MPLPARTHADRFTSELFRALADPSRRRLLDSLNARSGQTLRELCTGMKMARQSVIRTTPERLWQALTDPAFTERYWGVALESEWSTGSTVTLHQNGVTIADPEQVLLESDPYRRLAYTWQNFTPEWREVIGKRVGFSEAFLDQVAAEPRSKVSFEIQDLGDLVKLTVVHDGFEPGSVVLETISEGWPHILSNLKTLLETGETLPQNPPPAADAARS